jgi:hypothetical protein
MGQDTRSLQTELYNLAQAEPVTQVTNNPVQKPSGIDAWWVHGTLDTSSVYHPLGPVTGDAMVAQALVANRILVNAWRTGRGGQIDQFAIRVTAGAAGTARIVIYELDQASLYPSRLWFCSDTMDVSGVAVVTQDCLLKVPPDKLLAVGTMSDVTATLRAHNNISLYPQWGYAAALGTGGQIAINATFPYAKAPEQFPKGAAFVTATDIPAVFARFK